MALPLYAATLFVSAFILFLVQPMIGKMILPKLGGTPQVWNTCMVFFQMVLLAGYAYTHTVSTRLTLRQQLMLHGVLLFLPLLILLPNGPFNVADWRPTLGANPLFEALWLLLLIVGLPFFVVSTSAPLLQKWFVYTGHASAKDPYFLYGMSNLGSMLALLSYPVSIEWIFRLPQQAWIWTVGYIALVALVLVCAALVWGPSGALMRRWAGAPEAPKEVAPGVTAITAETPAAPASTGIKKAPKGPARGPGQRPDVDVALHQPVEEMTPWRRVRWILLAAVPSSLMLGVTTHITTDLSPIPLFWLVPLSLYLLSFILVFMRWPVTWIGEPHRIVLYVQPVAIALMIFVEIIAARDVQAIWVSIFCDILGFFVTALACHGELAKNRPSTKHLTEFYLLMSVGGMLGGMFNGLLAPILFVYVWEFNLAVMASCLVRPVLREAGWIEDLLAQASGGPGAGKGGKPKPQAAAEAQTANATTVLDFVVPLGITLASLVVALLIGHSGNPGLLFVAYGAPLILACLAFARPLRVGLAISGVILVYAISESRYDTTTFADRSYFGVLRVRKNEGPNSERISIGKDIVAADYMTLIHGSTDHGMNFVKPSRDDWYNKGKDFSRLATTYYHRLGPAGRVMQQYNWFYQESLEAEANTYPGDIRIGCYLNGMLGGDLGMLGGGLPLNSLVGLWSEPPYATIGLGTGTMASYSRPYQHVHYYEIDNHIRRLSLPVTEKEIYFTKESLENIEENFRARTKHNYFTYLRDAIKRRSEVQVLMGDAYLRMKLPYKNFHESPADSGGPEKFYHMMVVDAFTSDAIPVHLITREAIQMYFEKLVEKGILCVHTSNRHVNLKLVVAAVAQELKLFYITGEDEAPDNKRRGVNALREVGHNQSTWVMLARKREYLSRIEKLAKYWTPLPAPDRRFLWTEDHSNLFQVLNWVLPKELRR